MFFKKYWWLLIIVIVLLFLPLLINLCYYLESDCSALHAPSAWTSFWATYLAAIASFAMVVITYQTLKHSRRQLDELKQQWLAEHTPYLSCQLIAENTHFKLRIFNSSDIAATDVAIAITNHLIEDKPYGLSKLEDFLKNQVFVIPPKESLYFTIWITPYPEEENLPDGYIEIKLKMPTIDFGNYNLYPRNFAFVSYGDSVRPIVDEISKVADKIKDQKVILK